MKELLREQKILELAFTSKNIKEMHKLGMYMSIWSKQAKAIKIMLDLKKEIHCPYRLICEAIDSLCQGCCVCNLPYCLSSWRRNDNPRL